MTSQTANPITWTTVNTESRKLKQINCSSCQIERNRDRSSIIPWHGFVKTVKYSLMREAMSYFRPANEHVSDRCNILKSSLSWNRNSTINFPRMMLFMLDPPFLSLFSWKLWSILIEKQKQVIAENLDDFLKLTLNLAMVPPGNNTGNPAEPMSYNNAYKKVKNYLGNMLRGLLQRYPEVPTWMHFWSQWDSCSLRTEAAIWCLQDSENINIVSIPAPHSEPKNIPLKGGDPLNDTTILESFSAVSLFYFGGLKLGRSWSILDACCSDLLCACELYARWTYNFNKHLDEFHKPWARAPTWNHTNLNYYQSNPDWPVVWKNRGN